MKETGIIMSGDHPKLILDGIKTQTRRVIKPCSKATLADGSQPEWVFTLAKCPYGQAGDRLWVRETYTSYIDVDNHLCLVYYGDDIDSVRAYQIHHMPGLFFKQPKDGKHPSIHMPRWASRITLEITEVRVERVQEIRDSDIIPEGTRGWFDSHPQRYNRDLLPLPVINVDYFAVMWDEINKKRGYGWEVNPWVWVLSFKLIKGRDYRYMRL